MMDWFWDAIFNITHWRSNRRIDREMGELCAANSRMCAELDRMVAEAFTQNEWQVVKDRCEAKLADSVLWRVDARRP